MAGLDWPEKSVLHVVQSASKSEAEVAVERVTTNVKLPCKNEGRSPAWIDNVYGHREILPAASLLGNPNRSDGQKFGTDRARRCGRFSGTRQAAFAALDLGSSEALRSS